MWERKPRPDYPEEEKIDVPMVLECHDYCARPEPSALDIAMEKNEEQRQEIEQLHNKLQELTLRQSFGLERFAGSDEDIRFYTCDKELFKKSDIIPLLDRDMAIMVDKGFNIDDLVPCKGYRPAFLNKR
ncbi:hypothetical protein SKAU_G00207810 [Synaphobranchus kaupii]|uniref:Uncharacterized protein n=1 Tax=Synaphobranchus kaupii TaxID=118154 RepID=A0A9Q1F857_SYNKA|nr:hypothetical protein SKAU_G00207810 [Synaphobranchus kaupii]